MAITKVPYVSTCTCFAVSRTQIGDGRPNPAELRFGTAARIRPNSDLGRPSESGRTQIGDDRPNPAEKHKNHDRNQSFDYFLHVLGSKLDFQLNFLMILHGFAWNSSKTLFF